MLVLIDGNCSTLQCDQNGVAKCCSAEGPAGWASSFEKLLEDPLGLHTFAVSTSFIVLFSIADVVREYPKMHPSHNVKLYYIEANSKQIDTLLQRFNFSKTVNLMCMPKVK